MIGLLVSSTIDMMRCAVCTSVMNQGERERNPRVLGGQPIHRACLQRERERMSNQNRLSAADIERVRGYATCDPLVGDDMAKALAEITDRRATDLTADELVAIAELRDSILEPLADGRIPEIPVQPDQHRARIALAAISRIVLAGKVNR